MISRQFGTATLKAFNQSSKITRSFHDPRDRNFPKVLHIMSKHFVSASNANDLKNEGRLRDTSTEEVMIPVPWGHISGKWWGDRGVTPLIGLHGIQDNAGSFDQIAPMLDVPAFLALDAPGHGRSSHFPMGMNYGFLDFVLSLRRVVRHFGWKKISLLGHSFGSATSLVYCALYPDEVHSFTSIECARVMMALDGARGMPYMKDIILKALKSDDILHLDPPAYKWQEILTLFVKGNGSSILQERAVHILNRGTNPHPKIEEAFYFARDPRLRFVDYNRASLELQTQCVANIKCHVMTVYGKEGLILNNENPLVAHHYLEQEEILKKSASSFQRHELAGTHHLHLNNPEIVAPVVNNFIRKTGMCR